MERVFGQKNWINFIGDQVINKQVLQAFCAYFDIHFSHVIVLCGDTTEIVGHKIENTLLDYKTKTVFVSSSDFSDIFFDVVEADLLSWVCLQDVLYEPKSLWFLALVLYAHKNSTSVFVSDYPEAVFLTTELKYLGITQFSSELPMEILNAEYQAVFCTFREKRFELSLHENLSIRYLVGIVKKLPKKLAKNLCETVLGQKVVMVHKKIRN